MDQANDFFDFLVRSVTQGVTNFQRNLLHMFDDMNTTRYIRLIACVGAYLLLRPYFVKIGEKIQGKQLEKLSAKEDPYTESLKEKGGKKKITPNALRGVGGKTVSFKESEGEDAEASGVKWGKKARERQRKVVGKLLEEKEERLQEDDEEEDKDIMELLVDYEPGKDGW